MDIPIHIINLNQLRTVIFKRFVICILLIPFYGMKGIVASPPLVSEGEELGCALLPGLL